MEIVERAGRPDADHLVGRADKPARRVDTSRLRGVRASRPDRSEIEVRGAHRAAGGSPIARWLAERRVDVHGVTLDQVIGLPAAKREVASLIARLRNPERIREAGGELPRAVLIWGPAGTGKTLLARVIASALADDGDPATSGGRPVPFYELAGGDLTAARLWKLHDHFASRQDADGTYTVIFVDEIDAIARVRGDWRHTPQTRQALYALLAVLDGLCSTPNLLWLFTSNEAPDEMDPAVVRAGRIGFQVQTTYPSRAEREELFRHFAQGRRVIGEIDWRRAAEMTGPATTGADIRQALDDALALSLADGLEAIDWPHASEGIARRGLVRDTERRALTDEQRHRVALHESAHAIVGHLLGLPVSQVALEPDRGHTDYETEDGAGVVLTDGRLLDMIAADLAGIVAEQTFGSGGGPRDVTIGSASDLHHATAQALRRQENGTDPAFPFLSPDAWEPRVPPSLLDASAAAVAATLAEQRARAERLLREHEHELYALTELLLEHGRLSGTSLRLALVSVGLPDPGPELSGASGRSALLPADDLEPMRAASGPRLAS